MMKQAPAPLKVNFASLLTVFLVAVRRPLEWLRDYYAAVIGKSVTMRQCLHLIHAQVAFFATVLPADMPLTLRTVCLVWLIWALLKCKRELA